MPQRVGVIGLGHIGNRHASIYQEIENAELVALCDIDEDRAKAAEEKLGIKAWPSVKEMIRGNDLDMVSVATSGTEYGSDHYQPTMEALSAGLHVLGEKPISNEIGEAKEMVALAKEKKRCYGINLNHRFSPAARLAKQWMDDDKIGELLFMNMSMWINNPRESSPWFQIKALHPHTVDIMRHFCGDISHVHCFAMKAPGRSIWSTAQFNMRFKNGSLGHLTGSYDISRGHPMERCEVAGLKGRFVIDDIFREVTLYPGDSMEKTVYTNPIFGGMGSFRDTFQNRLECFVNQLESGTSPDDIDGSGKDGLAAQQVLACAIESIKTGETVEVPQC